MNLTLTNKRTMSSREIAELTGKEHKNILADCDKLNENYRVMGLAEISADYYKDTRNREQRHYLLTKLQTFDLMTGYDTKLRIKVNRRWAELEANNQHQIPQNFSEALKLAYEQSVKIEEQQKQLTAQTPLVTFAQALQISEHNILIGEMAKILKQNGINIGQNRLFDWLRDHSYLMNKGEQRNLPTQRAMDLKLFEVKTTTINNPDGSVRVTKTTKITPKGQEYIINKFLGRKNTTYSISKLSSS